LGCSKAFANKYNVKRHIENVHMKMRTGKKLSKSVTSNSNNNHAIQQQQHQIQVQQQQQQQQAQQSQQATSTNSNLDELKLTTVDSILSSKQPDVLKTTEQIVESLQLDKLHHHQAQLLMKSELNNNMNMNVVVSDGFCHNQLLDLDKQQHQQQKNLEEDKYPKSNIFFMALMTRKKVLYDLISTSLHVCQMPRNVQLVESVA
jgi:hypothetical protein